MNKWEAVKAQGSRGRNWNIGHEDVDGWKYIAEVPGWTENAEANARLIAAAPELCEALKQAQHEIERLAMVTGYEGEAHFPILQIARDALKAADGEKR